MASVGQGVAAKQGKAQSRGEGQSPATIRASLLSLAGDLLSVLRFP